MNHSLVNRLTSFQFENNIAHGAIVEISSGVGEMLDHRAYSGAVRSIIGQAMAAMPLFATHLRFEGRINLQFQGEGPMKLLVAQIDHQLNVRGMAKAPAELTGGFTDVLYGGILALMVEPTGETRNASQALVLIQGDSLAQALEGYFAQSEQLPTLIRLAADGDRLRGFMLQRLPLEHTRATDDDWEHLTTLASTLTESEMLDADAPTLLHRLFSAEDLRLFEPRPVTIACRCSHAGISSMLLQLGREEVDSIVAEQGKVEVTCEFCGRQYRFAAADVAALFAAESASSGTKH